MNQTETPILICVPDEPQFVRAPSSVRAIADCGHPVIISASGLGLVLTTPGLATFCLRCIPAGPKRSYVPEAIRNELATWFGNETADDMVRRFTWGGPGD